MFYKIIQVYPTKDYKVYLYFSDGRIKLFDARKLITQGVFTKLQNISLFIETCTVMNDTLAWDVSGKYDPSACLDLDPEELYRTCPEVKESDIVNW